MKFDDIKKLQQRKYRESCGYFLVEGEHLVLELQKAAQHNPLLQHSELYVTGEHESWKSPFATHLISARQMAQIAETKSPQGIAAVVPLIPAPARKPSHSNNSADLERAIYLHEIQDPGNLGSILRSLAWFGGLRCLLSPGSVDPYNSKAVRASMGAIFHVPFEIDITLDSLPERFARMACLDTRGESLRSDGFRNFDCYLFGNEARGLPREQLAELKAQSFSIAATAAAGRANIESLNLAASVHMCVYELNRDV